MRPGSLDKAFVDEEAGCKNGTACQKRGYNAGLEPVEPVAWSSPI